MRRFLIRPADPFLITWDLTSVTSAKQDSPKSRTFQNTFSWFTTIRVRSKASYLLPFVCGYLKLRIIHFRNDVSSCKYGVVKQSCWKTFEINFPGPQLEKPHECEFCGKKFSEKRIMRHHIKIKHERPNEADAVSCDLCGENFPNRFDSSKLELFTWLKKQFC